MSKIYHSYIILSEFWLYLSVLGEITTTSNKDNFRSPYPILNWKSRSGCTLWVYTWQCPINPTWQSGYLQLSFITCVFAYVTPLHNFTIIPTFVPVPALVNDLAPRSLSITIKTLASPHLHQTNISSILLTSIVYILYTPVQSPMVPAKVLCPSSRFELPEVAMFSPLSMQFFVPPPV